MRPRTREIGARVALGAETGDVRDMFIRQGLTMAVAGIALGLPCPPRRAARIDAIVALRVEM